MLTFRTIAAIVLAVNFVHMLLARWRKLTVTSKIETVEAEIRELKRQAAPLNAPATFAKYAKISREVTRREKELEVYRSKSNPSRLEKAISRVPMATKVSLYVILALSTGIRVPAMHIPGEYVGPLRHFVSSKKAPVGNITASAWIYLCELAAGAVAGFLVDVALGLSRLTRSGAAEQGRARGAAAAAAAAVKPGVKPKAS